MIKKTISTATAYIKKIVSSIAIDKKDHVLLGIAVGFPLVLLFGFYGGLVALALVGLKELIYDWLLKKGTPEWMDFAASAIPIIMFIIINKC
jgi:hypothetical protein